MTLDPALLRLYLVADPEHTAAPLAMAVGIAVQAGVSTVQLRAKQLDDRSVLDTARTLREICHEHGAIFLVNDRVDIALLSGADGVHVGVNDIMPEELRRLVPSEFIIGYSPDSNGDPSSAGADYLGIGPVFGTTSKSDAGAALGLTAFAHRVRTAHLPVVGIGGINQQNARSVMEAGASGVAVISTILGSGNVEVAAKTLREVVDRFAMEARERQAGDAFSAS